MVLTQRTKVHTTQYGPHSDAHPHKPTENYDEEKSKHTTEKYHTDVKHPHSIQDQLHKNKYDSNKGEKPPKHPNDYYAVIPYKDVNKLFDLLNKHVHEPIKYTPPKVEKKKKHKGPIKTTITHFRIPQEKKKRKMKKKGRKKVVEICSQTRTNFFPIFTLGTLTINAMIDVMFNLMAYIMISATGVGNAIAHVVRSVS